MLTDATNENDPDLDAVNSGNASLGPDGTPRTDSLSITGVVHGTVANTFTVSSAGANSGVVGTYGSVNIASDGSYTYTLDNTNGTVQALATAEELTDTFTFTVSDGNEGFTSNTLTITIIGTNDAPAIEARVAVDPTTLTTNDVTIDTANNLGIEGSTVNATPGALIAYGKAGLNGWAFRYVPDNGVLPINNSFFGDPLVGVQKYAYPAELINGLGGSASAELDETNTTLSATCLLYTSPSPRDGLLSRMPSSA